MSAMANVIPLKDLTPKTDRSYYIRNKQGDVVGHGYKVPKGDFSRFLGFKEPTEKEKQGETSGARTIEVAIQKQFNQLGEATTKSGSGALNLWVASGRFEQRPGQEKEAIAANMDALKESVEMGHASGMQYLEMQYKFQYLSMSFGTISNLMKARNDSVKKAINEVR
ncbi:MAG: hypothetical protein HY903_19110 [Deltaproteobacteria bacterium]|nr:hypothetical protein [Deltaproteobacteria bacterium]